MGQQQLLLIVQGVIIVGLAIVVGINLFGASATRVNHDAIIADLTQIASMAQQYYRRPESLGGGNNSFAGWKLSPILSITENMSAAVTTKVDAQLITLVAVSKEMGNNGSGFIHATMVVGPNSIISTVFDN